MSRQPKPAMMRAKTVPMRPLPTMPTQRAMEVEAEQTVECEVAVADAVVGLRSCDARG